MTRIKKEEAADLAGLPVKTFVRLVNDGSLPITTFKISRKAEKFYCKEDIETLLNQRSVKKTA
jgi:hypothetical protein